MYWAINASQAPPPTTINGLELNLFMSINVLNTARWYSSSIIFEFARSNIVTDFGDLQPSTNTILSSPTIFS